ncbi:putative inorganic phosphate cotransporter isoform X2 [Anthonomus grandis grandis]|uniref:putative inorganic phosphate cotransporter isoform X2 n=1 Tax=Anthonomus grandis grandis TaxID=2921223 RepID=UPI002165F4DF|nr:putative inorganic phosphate cotransporter isoform X2 [Anthonomus grandis grandis]
MNIMVAAFGLWIPLNERSFLTMIVMAGYYVSCIISMLITGYVSASWWGWPAAFYIFGVFCILWCVIWWIFAADSPKKHPRITKSERKYIEESLQSAEKTENKSIPLKAIFTSVPFWSALIANIGYSWVLTISETQVPTYLKNIFNFDIASNGATASSPYIVQLLATVLLAPLGDFLVSRNYIMLMTWRRISQFLGAIVPAFVIVWLAFIRAEQTSLAVFLLNVGLGMQSITLFGSSISHVDLTPRFAGVAFCIDNTTVQVLCIFAPIMVQYVVTDLTDLILWRSVFLSMAGLCMLTSLVYMVFGSADIQWWNDGSKKKETDN